MFLFTIGTLPLSTEAAVVVLNDLNIKSHWDSSFDSGLIIKHLDSYTTITYAQYKGIFPTKPRDLLYRSHIHYLQDPTTLSIDENSDILATSFSIVSDSNNNNIIPEKSTHIRSELIYAGMYLQSIREDPLSCRVTYLVANNPKGSLPSFAVSVAASKAPLVIASLRKFIKQNHVHSQGKEH